MINVIIADDHAIVSGGLRQILSRTPDIHVGSCVGSGAELLAALRGQSFDALLTDLSMPGASGVELIDRIHRLHPRLPIVVLSMHDQAPIVTRALKAGASGYVTKDSEPETLIAAIRTCAAGGRYLDPSLVDRVVFETQKPDGDPLDSLTDRELQVLTSFARGYGLNEIAAQLNVSPKTVSTHKMRLMQKLGIARNADLVRFAMEHGIVGT